MRKYILSLFFVCSTVLAFAAPEPYAHLLFYEGTDKNFFEKIVSGEKATYSICVSRAYKKLNEEEANEYFLRAFNSWFDRLNRYIKNKKGFDDLLPIIENANNIERLPCKYFTENKKDIPDPDLMVKFDYNVPDICNNAPACFMIKTGEIAISRKLPVKKIKVGITHELGHAFGLGDQYDGETYTGSFIYNTQIKRPGIMGTKNRLTCDDIDGLISSIDRIKNTGREFDSLCRDGIHISNGIPQDKTGSKYKLKENYDTFDADITITYDKDVQESNTYLMDLTMTNFLIDNKGAALLKVMGFVVTDFQTVKDAEVKIHGRIKETLKQKKDDTNEEIYRIPLGLWSLILYVNGEEKQIVTAEYLDDVTEITRHNIDEKTWETVDNILLPLINYYPFQGIFRKEAIRQEFIKAQKKKHKNFSTKIGPANAVSSDAFKYWGNIKL